MNTRPSRFNPTWSLALAGALAASAVPARAQQLIAWPIGTPNPFRFLLPGQPIRPLPLPHPRPLPRPIPRPGPDVPVIPSPDARPLELSGYQVEGSIEDQAADLVLRITFQNTTPQRLEGVLVLPIPADTVMSGFTMTVGGKESKGELLDAGEARTIYENIVRQTRDPGLLELSGERMIRARVFPIEPHGVISVRLGLTQVLKKSGELVSLSVPLRSAQMLQGRKGAATVRLQLHASRPLRTLYSPSEAVIRRIGADRAEIVYEERTAGEAKDLNLFYSMQQDPLAAGLLAFREEGEDGTFMVTLAPKPEIPAGEALPKDIVFIVDRSGSMQEGGKMDQARRALAYCLGRLGPKDRFGIVDFATDWNAFESRLVAADAPHTARAKRYVERLEAAGGTNIEAGLKEGLRLLEGSSGRLPMVFFLTDGLPTVGENRIEALLQQAAAANAALRARVFSFGVGTDVNTLFLDKLAEANRGSRDYVAPEEDIENKVSSLYRQIEKPALTDVRIEWRGLEVAEVQPRAVTDLFHGTELVLLGRYREAGKGTLVVTGKAGAREARFEFPVELPAKAGRNAFLPRLWAHRKVASEMDAIRLSGRADPEVVKDIVRLAKRYGIVTPYTSYLVTEDGFNLGQARAEAVRGFEALSADAAASGFSGGSARSRAAQRASTFFGAMGAKSAALAPAAAAPAALREAEDEVRNELKAAGKDAVATKSVGGKTFYRRGEAWVDGEYEPTETAGKSVVEVACLSPEYFDLLRKRPELSRYLSVGDAVTVVFGGIVYKIVPGR